MNELIKSYGEYLSSISRSEMFDAEGNYNEILKSYHLQFRMYAENGTQEEKTKSNFLLNII
jgi:hypothetical protein